MGPLMAARHVEGVVGYRAVRQHFWPSGKHGRELSAPQFSAPRPWGSRRRGRAARGAETEPDTRILSSGEMIQLLQKIGIKDSFNR